ncbi:MAG: PilZ domain-containing protein [Vicinamibacteria bacterium]
MEGNESDRRRWARIPVRGEIVGQIYTETAAPIVDLSEGGALLEVPCVLRPRSLYTLRLVLGRSVALTLKASVVRSYVHHFEDAGGGETRVRYQAALQFVEMGDADRFLLRQRLSGEDGLAEELSASLSSGSHADSAPPTLESLVEPDPLLHTAPLIPNGASRTPALGPLPGAAAPSPFDAPGSEAPRRVPAGPATPAQGGPRPFGWVRSLWQTKPPAESFGSLLGLHQPERRDAPRVSADEKGVEGEVGLQLETDVLTLSPGGMMARMPFAPALGSIVRCALQVEGEAISVRGSVRNSQPDASASPDEVHSIVGIEFVELGERERSLLERYLARRSAGPGSE